MINGRADPMIDIAEAISNLFGHIGYAFIEDQHVEVLAATLRDFFETQEIPLDEQRAAAYYSSLPHLVDSRIEA
ncbi:hypothetical protein ACQPZJ_19525 [Actinoplanes sp. CA-054009]